MFIALFTSARHLYLFWARRLQSTLMSNISYSYNKTS